MYKTTRHILSVALTIFFLSKTCAETAQDFELQYIKNNWNGSYDFVMKNPWDTISRLKIFIDDVAQDSVFRQFSGQSLNVLNLIKSNWSAQIEKIYDTYSWSVISWTWTIKSNKIQFRKEDFTALKPYADSDNRSWRYFTVLWFEKNLSDWINNSEYNSITRNLVLNINWTDYPITKDASTYEDWKYYYNSKYISFPTSNLKDYANVIKLKIDWVYSNYIVVKKEKYQLDRPTEVILEDWTNTKLVKIKYKTPIWLWSISQIEAYANGKKLDSGSYTEWLWMLIVRFDMMSLDKNTKNVAIQLKNPNTNDYSNISNINVWSLISNSISKVDLWDWKGLVFNFKIDDTLGWIAWDISKIKINLNGSDYSVDWTKVVLKYTDWQIMKDGLWNEKFEIQNKLDFKRVWWSLSFEFWYSRLKDWENMIYVKNENTGTQSNIIRFMKGDYTNINYNYSTWSTSVASSWNTESATLTQWTSIAAKRIDFMNKPERDIIIWKLTFGNLKENDSYLLGFKIKTNSTINSYSEVKFNWEYLIPILEQDKTISYVFEKIASGKDIKDWDIVFTLNELFNSPNQITKLHFWDFYLKRYNMDWTIASALENSISQNFSLGYLYSFWNCFDWDKEYCTIAWLSDPYLVIDLAFWEQEITPLVQTDSSIESVTSTTTRKITNPEIVTIAYKSDKLKAYNNKFKLLYEQIKQKWITWSDLVGIKNSINAILRWLKNIEDKRSMSTSTNIVKNNIRNILNIIKKASK